MKLRWRKVFTSYKGWKHWLDLPYVSNHLEYFNTKTKKWEYIPVVYEYEVIE